MWGDVGRCGEMWGDSWPARELSAGRDIARGARGHVSPDLPVSRPTSPRSCKNLSTRRERTEESLRISAESCMLSREMLRGTSSESTTCSVNTPAWYPALASDCRCCLSLLDCLCLLVRLGCGVVFLCEYASLGAGGRCRAEDSGLV